MTAQFWTRPRLAGLSLRRMLVWLVLALPAFGLIRGVVIDPGEAHRLLHPTGEFGIRLMLLAMLVGPLVDMFGPNRFLRGWMSLRRNLGVAAFGYALLHLVYYVIDKGTLAAVVAEFPLASIWTGWLSFAAMLAAAAISADWAVRRMGRNWKRVQQAVYPAYVLAVLHWGLLEGHWQPALIHLAPLALVWALRAPLKARRRARSATAPAAA